MNVAHALRAALGDEEGSIPGAIRSGEAAQAEIRGDLQVARVPARVERDGRVLHLEAGVELVDDDGVGVGPSAVRNAGAVVLDLIGADRLGGGSDRGEGVRCGEKTLGQRLVLGSKGGRGTERAA